MKSVKAIFFDFEVFKYDYYLKSVEDYTKVINKEVFDILMKEGSK